jgi:hypothetical protein
VRPEDRFRTKLVRPIKIIFSISLVTFSRDDSTNGICAEMALIERRETPLAEPSVWSGASCASKASSSDASRRATISN